jgi:WXG100 family type VII secretion target
MAAEEPAADRAAMVQAASHVESAAGVIRELRSAMNEYSFALQRGWTGQAASAFGGACEAFSAEFAAVLNALQLMRDQLTSAPDGR